MHPSGLRVRRPFLIFGEGMSGRLQLSQAQLFAFPSAEQRSVRPRRRGWHGRRRGALARKGGSGSKMQQWEAVTSCQVAARRSEAIHPGIGRDRGAAFFFPACFFFFRK